MIDENELEGGAQELGGKVQDAIGGLTGDTKTQAEGKWNKTAGHAQKTLGSAAEELRDILTEQPFTALALVAASAFALGLFARR